MQTIQFPSLADDVRTLPAGGAARARRLRRIVDAYATHEAATALEAAAARETGVTAGALTAAGAALAGDDAARDRLREAVASPAFLALVPAWIRELRAIAATRPDGGACTVASALELWSWTMKHFRAGNEPAAVDDLSGAIAPLLAARALALAAADGSGEQLRSDLAAVNAARAAATSGATCAELVFGYRRHLVWDEAGCATCFDAESLDDLEELIPGIASGARMSSDVIEPDGSHASKRGPCVRFDGVDAFMRLRARLDGCLTGARLATDRAAAAIARSMETTTPSR